jgi:hypothetical protein
MAVAIPRIALAIGHAGEQSLDQFDCSSCVGRIAHSRFRLLLFTGSRVKLQLTFAAASGTLGVP